MSMSILTAVTTAANVVFDADASVLGCGCTHKPPVPHLPNLLPATETDRTSSANVTSCASREALSQNLSVQAAAAAPIAEPCCVEAPQPRASDVAGSLFQSSAAAATSPYHRRQHRAAVAFVRDCLWQALQACLELCWIALVIVVFVIGCSLSRRIESMRASCNRAGLQVALSEVSRGEVEFAAHPAVQYAEPPAVILGPRSPNKLEGDSPTSLDCSLGPSYALDLILPHIWSQSALRSNSICDHIHGNCSSIRAPGVLDNKRNTRRENSLPMVRAASAVRGFLQTDCDSRIQRNQCKEGDADASSLYEGMNGLSHTLETEVLHYQQEATPGDDEAALIAFKQAIQVDHLNVLESWTSDRPVCSWEGVSCRSAAPQRVIGLTISQGFLEGSLTPEISKLDQLRKLHVDGGMLMGKIPPQVAQLRWLTSVDLSSNHLTGEIPPSFSLLSNLRNLALRSNNFSGAIPPGIFLLPKLETLALDINNLTGALPDGPGSYSPSLVSLSLGVNYLSGPVPKALGDLPNLVQLDLHQNSFSGPIPPELGALTKLEYLDISSNQLTGGIPHALAGLSSLQAGVFSNNQLSGVVSQPFLVGIASTIDVLDVGRNAFTGSISRFALLTNAVYIELSNNKFVGGITKAFGAMPNLQQLGLSDNELTGGIPAGITESSSLVVFSADRNKLRGSIPPFRCTNTGFMALTVSGNSFHGGIPHSLAGCNSSLYVLDSSAPNVSRRTCRDYHAIHKPAPTVFRGSVSATPLTSICLPRSASVAASTTAKAATSTAKAAASAVAEPAQELRGAGPVVVVDNYDSFTYNLCQYLGDLGCEHVVYRNDDITIDDLQKMDPRGVLISPGPGTPDDSGISLDVVRRLGPTVPLFGVCMGLQCMGQAYGGRIVRAPGGVMHGKTSPVLHSMADSDSGLLAGLPSPFTACRYHSLVIEKDTFPEDELEVTAWTEDGLVMAVRHKKYTHVEGVQFHPESIITSNGKEIVANFLKTMDRYWAQ
ncbi:unnamed protein product [Closterium sp. NIES-65]|nr:unnamed protein product [Closterium sp. NIES-65]